MVRSIKLSQLIFYCIGISTAIYIYGVQAALFLALFVITVAAYGYLAVEIYLMVKNSRVKTETTNKKEVGAALLALLFTVLGAFFFTKLVWVYTVFLVAIVLLRALYFNWSSSKVKSKGI